MKDKTVLFGNGTTTGRIAAELLNNGIEIIIATPQADVVFDRNSDTIVLKAPGVEFLTRATLKKCVRESETYHLTFAKGTERFSREAAHIILCDDYRRESEFTRYGLKPSENVIPLSQLTVWSEEKIGPDGSIVFLSGIGTESNPVVSRQIMESALGLMADRRHKVYILTENLKVAARGLEALYRSARQAGVVFIKLNREKPDIQQRKNGRVTVTFKDEITGHFFRLSPELVIVDERLSASETTVETARVLAIDQDTQGFAQSDNVHRMTVLTNRQDIFSAGSSRAVLAVENQDMDVKNAVLSVMTPSGLCHDRDDAYAEITPDRCVRCLTCYRLCPFGAVRLNGHLQVNRDLCEGCGICRAECPKKAIELKNLATGTPADQIADIPVVDDKNDLNPVIYAFCCSRSARQAWELARSLGCSLPKGLRIIEVPCAGAISTGDLLKAYQKNADGVLVLTCHVDNCHAEQGNLHAHRRVDGVSDLLAQVGLKKERLLKTTLASNMGNEFSDIVNGFADRLKQMGPVGV